MTLFVELLLFPAIKLQLSFRLFDFMRRFWNQTFTVFSGSRSAAASSTRRARDM